MRLVHNVDRFPHFIAMQGATGTINYADDASVCVRMDDHLPGAEEWDNEIVWTSDEADFRWGTSDPLGRAGVRLHAAADSSEGDDMIEKYRKLRRENPYLPAHHALAIAKAKIERGDWEQDAHDRWTLELEGGLTALLTVETESIFPKDHDYGEYADAVSSDYDWDWEGNYPRPAADLPLNLPYTIFHCASYSHSSGSGGYPYFIPDGVEDRFNEFRKAGASKAVAWDLTRQWVEDTVRSFFGGPLTYLDVGVEIRRTVQHDGRIDSDVVLGSSHMGTSIIDDEDGHDHVFELAQEMLPEALDEARETLNDLRKVSA